MASERDTATGRWSVAFPRRHWYAVCRSDELARRPREVLLMNRPLVVFRDGTGAPRALLDRCPHRNVPLSLGRVRSDGCLECAYHGWSFDGSGTCVEVPGRFGRGDAAAPTRNVSRHAALEQDGFVFVWGEPDAEPDTQPFAAPDLGRGVDVGEVVFTYDLDCTMHAAIENALDVPHTAFLHRGIFRGGDQRDITAVRREVPGGVEVQYLGEPVGMGPVRGTEGSATFDHWDRFFLPNIAQVEYRVDGWLRIVNTIHHLPLSERRTRAWFVVRFWTRLPAMLVRPIVLARGLQIVRQDVRVLAHQTRRISDLGGEQYASTDLDVLGNAIWRLLRRAERAEQGAAPGASSDGDADGDGDGDEPIERTVTIRV